MDGLETKVFSLCFASLSASIYICSFFNHPSCQVHHALPRSIIVYRDGVSEGQLHVVEGHEIPQLATVFMHFDSYDPKLSFVVVQKRLNTRIFTAMVSVHFLPSTLPDIPNLYLLSLPSSSVSAFLNLFTLAAGTSGCLS